MTSGSPTRSGSGRRDAIGLGRGPVGREGHPGGGGGFRLGHAAIAEAGQAIGLEQITLRVSTSSNSAIRLYERVGFKGCGVLPHAIKLVEGPGQVRYHDKLTMVLIL